MKNNFKKLAVVAIAAASLSFTGCGDSLENFVITQNQAVAPVAVNDTITALGNATLNQSAANGVLTNDAPSNGAITAFDATSVQGATVVLNADGSFTYTPVFGFTGTDSFTYTLSNTAGASTATVTVNVPNEGFFVNNQAAPGGNGAQATPFDTLAAAVAAAGNGDVIYVLRGDGTAYPGGFNLPAGVSLIGEGNGLVVAQQIEAAGQQAEIQGTVTLLGDNTVSGCLFTGNNDAIQANGVSNLNITNNTFQTVATEQINIDNIGGTLTISNNTFEVDGDNNGVDLTNTDVNLTAVVSNNTTRLLTGGTGNGDDLADLDFNGNSVATVTFNGNNLIGDSTQTNLESGLDMSVSGTANVTVTASGNTADDIRDELFDFTVFGNATGTITITGSTVTNIDSGAYELVVLSSSDSGNLTAIVSNNSSTAVGDNGAGIALSANDMSTAALAARTNNITNADADPTISVSAQTDSTVCLDINGNTLTGGDLRITGENNAVLDIERFDAGTGGPLDTVNTITGGMLDIVQNGASTFNPRAAGFCNIP